MEETVYHLAFIIWKALYNKRPSPHKVRLQIALFGSNTIT